MKRELDKLENEANYRIKVEMYDFALEGDVLTGKFIKAHCPFDISKRDGLNTFFEKLKA